jgi:hypothetical protein
MATRYEIATDRIDPAKVRGPVTFRELAALIATRNVPEDVDVRTVDGGDWMDARDVVGLMSTVARIRTGETGRDRKTARRVVRDSARIKLAASDSAARVSLQSAIGWRVVAKFGLCLIAGNAAMFAFDAWCRLESQRFPDTEAAIAGMVVVPFFGQCSRIEYAVALGLVVSLVAGSVWACMRCLRFSFGRSP